MRNPFTIQVRCPDGSPENMREVSTSGWTGKIFYISRDYWANAAMEYRDELKKPGVYILTGDSFEGGDNRQKIYIGHADNLRTRIEQHTQDPKRIFFQRIVCVIEHGDFNSAHFKWMESYLITRAKDIGRCVLDNNNTPNKPQVSRTDEDAIKSFLENVCQMFFIVDINAFVVPKRAPKLPNLIKDHQQTADDDKATKERAGNNDVATSGKRKNLHSPIRDEGKLLPSMTNTEHFRVLGLCKDKVVIQVKSNNALRLIPPARLTSPNVLITLASLAWWYDLLGVDQLAPRDCRVVADAINRAGEEVGFVDPSTAVGRGAWRNEKGDTVLYNLGDKFLLQDENGLLTREAKFLDIDQIFLPGPSIAVKSETDNALEVVRLMAKSVLAYRWASKNDGLAFLGWLVTALIGGALSVRPMTWLLAPTSSGKSYLAESVITPFFGDLVEPIIGDASEAGLISHISSDSLPVVFEEFEPGSGRIQKKNWDNVLKVILQAISNNEGRPRSVGSGKMVKLRFSAIAMSRSRKLSPADSQKFFPLSLSLIPVDDWPAVQNDIKSAFTESNCEMVRSLIIRETPHLVKRIDALEDELSKGSSLGMRQRKIIAALSVGANFFTGEETMKIIQRTETREEDTLKPLEVMLSASTPYYEEGRSFSIAECLQAGYWPHGKFEKPWGSGKRVGKRPKAARIAASYGFAMGRNESEMWVCPSCPEMKELLAKSKFSNIDLNKYIRNLPGVSKPKLSNGTQCRMVCGEHRRWALAIPKGVFEGAGFCAPIRQPTQHRWDDSIG